MLSLRQIEQEGVLADIIANRDAMLVALIKKIEELSSELKKMKEGKEGDQVQK